MALLATDGVNFPSMSSTGTGCWVKFTYPVNHVGQAEQFKFFMDYFTSSSTYDGKLKLQGSNDNFVDEIDTLVTVGDEIHEGWNYYDIEEETPGPHKYKSYRMYSGGSSGCDKIGEVELYGSEVIDSTDTTEICTGNIIIWDSDGEYVTS